MHFGFGRQAGPIRELQGQERIDVPPPSTLSHWWAITAVKFCLAIGWAQFLFNLRLALAGLPPLTARGADVTTQWGIKHCPPKAGSRVQIQLCVSDTRACNRAHSKSYEAIGIIEGLLFSACFLQQATPSSVLRDSRHEAGFRQGLLTERWSATYGVNHHHWPRF